MESKKFIITTSAATLVALAAVGSIAFASMAADNGAGNGLNLFNGRMGQFKNLTEEERSQMIAERETRKAEMDILHVNVETALDNKDFNAWQEAVSAINSEAPILDQIDAANFGRFTEAHELIRQGRTILEEELGVERGGMGRRGLGMHNGMRGGFGPINGVPAVE